MSSITAIVQLDAPEVVLKNLNGFKLGAIMDKEKRTTLTELKFDGSELAIAFAPLIRSYAAKLVLLDLRCSMYRFKILFAELQTDRRIGILID